MIHDKREALHECEVRIYRCFGKLVGPRALDSAKLVQRRSKERRRLRACRPGGPISYRTSLNLSNPWFSDKNGCNCQVKYHAASLSLTCAPSRFALRASPDVLRNRRVPVGSTPDSWFSVPRLLSKSGGLISRSHGSAGRAVKSTDSLPHLISDADRNWRARRT